MNFVLALLLLWMGVGDPSDLAHELNTVAQERLVDPVERWRPLITAQFPDEEVDTALCIVQHESAGNPQAANPSSTASGLFQILGSLWGPRFGVSYAQLHQPDINVRIARQIWEQQGWWAWSPYQRGACR